MSKRTPRVLAALLLLLALLAPAPAQDVDQPEPPETFKLEEGSVRVLDKFRRPFLMPKGTAWIGARLDLDAEGMSPFIKDYEVLSAGGLDYEVKKDADYVKFPLENGRATVRFVAFTDPASNPVLYELVFMHKVKGKDVVIKLNDQAWRAGDPATVGSRTLTTPSDRAPNQTWDWALLIGFVLTGVVLAYVLFGRSLFARMLRVKRMEVTTALGYSNLLVLLGLGLVLLCGAGLYMFPKILWGKQVMIYLVVGGGCLAGLGAGYGAGVVLTKA